MNPFQTLLVSYREELDLNGKPIERLAASVKSSKANSSKQSNRCKDIANSINQKVDKEYLDGNTPKSVLVIGMPSNNSNGGLPIITPEQGNVFAVITDQNPPSSLEIPQTTVPRPFGGYVPVEVPLLNPAKANTSSNSTNTIPLATKK